MSIAAESQLSDRKTRTGAAVYSVPVVTLAGAVFFAATWWGGLDGVSGAVAAVAVALLLPRLAPCVLLFIAVVQDSPGLNGNLWYASFAAVATIMFLRSGSGWLNRLLIGTAGTRSRLGLRHGRIVALFAAVALYGLAVTFIVHMTGQYPYSPRRPPLATGILILVMLLAGYVGAAAVIEDGNGLRRVNSAINICLANVAVVLFFQLTLGIWVYRSPQGLQAVMSAAQLSGSGSLGAVRLTGTYLTPDGFAFVVLLLLALKTAIRSVERGGVSGSWFFSFLLCGAGVCALTLSKNAIILYAFLTALIMLNQLNPAQRAKVAVAGLFTLVAAGGWVLLNSSRLIGALRVPTAATYEATYRYIAWHAAVTQFSLHDWLLGTGLSYWPVMLAENAAGGIASPHTWLLFVPGTYGVLGLAAYAGLAWHIWRSMHGPGPGRVLVGTIATLVFVVGAFSINLAFGHMPLSYLVWVTLGIGVALSRRSVAAE